MPNSEIAATTLTEPYITLAEKQGCRTICSGFVHGTEVGSERVDAQTYAAFNRAVQEAKLLPEGLGPEHVALGRNGHFVISTTPNDESLTSTLS